jgi:hypothetical protein
MILGLSDGGLLGALLWREATFGLTEDRLKRQA